jgi:hypothetical protein
MRSSSNRRLLVDATTSVFAKRDGECGIRQDRELISSGTAVSTINSSDVRGDRPYEFRLLPTESVSFY